MATAIQYSYAHVVPRPGYALVLREPDDNNPQTFFATVLVAGEKDRDSLRPSPGTRVFVRETRDAFPYPGNPVAEFVPLHAIIAEVPA